VVLTVAAFAVFIADMAWHGDEESGGIVLLALLGVLLTLAATIGSAIRQRPAAGLEPGTGLGGVVTL
jgi:hypothetical protein